MTHRATPSIPNGPRRLFLRYTLASVAAVAAAGVAGVELVNHGVLPGKSLLDKLDGACSVPAPDLTPYAAPGPSLSGTFYSRAGTGRSDTRSPIRPGTGPATGCRW